MQCALSSFSRVENLGFFRLSFSLLRFTQWPNGNAGGQDRKPFWLASDLGLPAFVKVKNRNHQLAAFIYEVAVVNVSCFKSVGSQVRLNPPTPFPVAATEAVPAICTGAASISSLMSCQFLFIQRARACLCYQVSFKASQNIAQSWVQSSCDRKVKRN